MVNNGWVYVGSQDSSEYALNGADGAELWTHQTLGPIVSNTIFLTTKVAVGSEDGTLYYLNLHTGSVVNSYFAHSPILGLAGSPCIVVATLKNGQAVGNRIGGQETTWKYYGDGTALATAALVDNGNIFVTCLDGNLYLFGTPGGSTRARPSERRLTFTRDSTVALPRGRTVSGTPMPSPFGRRRPRDRHPTSGDRPPATRVEPCGSALRRDRRPATEWNPVASHGRGNGALAYPSVLQHVCRHSGLHAAQFWREFEPVR